MIEIVPNWHPIFVHFTVALLSVSIGFFLKAVLTGRSRLRAQWLLLAHWNLWVGVGFTVITVIAGWFAFNSVTHDDASHEVMIEHRNLAMATLAAFLAMAVWAWMKKRDDHRVSAWFLTAMLAGGGLLGSTAWHGAELVYAHGLGVKSLPNPNKATHGHGGEGAVEAPHDGAGGAGAVSDRPRNEGGGNVLMDAQGGAEAQGAEHAQ